MLTNCENCIYRVSYHSITKEAIVCELSYEKKAKEGNCSFYSKTVLKNLDWTKKYS